jgi:hypothetical protein
MPIKYELFCNLGQMQRLQGKRVRLWGILSRVAR